MKSNFIAPKVNLYIAGPLFSLAERDFNSGLKKKLSPYFNIYLPQEDGGLMVDMIKDGIPSDKAAKKVFVVDINALDKSDIFLIVLDGRTIDEGASFELGYCFAKGKPCIGFKTNPRQLLPTGINPMINLSLMCIFESISNLIKWAKSYKMYDIVLKRRVDFSTI